MHRAPRLFVVALFVLVVWYGYGVLRTSLEPSTPNTPTLTVRTTDASRGPANAAVTIVEFADFSCPFCRTSAIALDVMEREFSGSIIRVWKDYPLAENVEAEPAARAAYCAGRQGKFWEMHTALFARQKELAAGLYTSLARTLALDGGKFSGCMASAEAAAAVHQNVEDAAAAHVDGIPFVFVNGTALTGTVTQNALREAITAALARGQR